MLFVCAGIAIVGVGLLAGVLTGQDTWTHLVVGWLALTPLWAVLTAWLGRERPAATTEELPNGTPLPWSALWPRRSKIPPAQLVDTRGSLGGCAAFGRRGSSGVDAAFDRRGSSGVDAGCRGRAGFRRCGRIAGFGLGGHRDERSSGRIS